MVPTRFASLVLALLYVLHALRDSSAYAHEGIEMLGNGLMATGENLFTVQKELLDNVPAAVARKMKLGGRKMMAVARKEIEKEVNEEASKMSGMDTNASEKTGRSQDHFNVQNNSLSKPKTLKPVSLGISVKEPVHFPSTKSHHFQDSKAVSTSATLNNSSRPNKQVSEDKEPPHEAAQKDESQGFLEADDEVVNMMGKDYRGMDNPPRKPPINNDKPTND